MSRDFQSFAGPGDRDLPMSEIQGYQPVSRIGEIVMNSFGAHAHPSPRMRMPTHHLAFLPSHSQSTRTSTPAWPTSCRRRICPETRTRRPHIRSSSSSPCSTVQCAPQPDFFFLASLLSVPFLTRLWFDSLDAQNGPLFSRGWSASRARRRRPCSGSMSPPRPPCRSSRAPRACRSPRRRTVSFATFNTRAHTQPCLIRAVLNLSTACTHRLLCRRRSIQVGAQPRRRRRPQRAPPTTARTQLCKM